MSEYPWHRLSTLGAALPCHPMSSWSWRPASSTTRREWARSERGSSRRRGRNRRVLRSNAARMRPTSPHRRRVNTSSHKKSRCFQRLRESPQPATPFRTRRTQTAESPALQQVPRSQRVHLERAGAGRATIVSTLSVLQGRRRTWATTAQRCEPSPARFGGVMLRLARGSRRLADLVATGACVRFLRRVEIATDGVHAPVLAAAGGDVELGEDVADVRLDGAARQV
jgi:hypothetical protein